jgi:polar amino acid transport system substrate-binding protein
MRAQVYIGFSLDTPPAMINRLQHALDTMKGDGSFALLYQKWLPGEKPPGVEPDQSSFPF